MTKKRMFFTAGYEGLSIAEYLDGLEQNGIATLFDIRYRPQSRKAGFSKKALAKECQKRGLNYVHNKDLGTPPDQMTEMKRNGGYDTALFEKYRAFLLTKRDALREAANAVLEEATCFMCYEMNHEACHRRIVAEEIERTTNASVLHLKLKN